MSIRIVTEPSVYVLARQAIDENELARYLESVGAPDWSTDAPSAAERLAEISGRCCYQSWKNGRPGGNAAYLGHILEERHGSVLEHCVWTLLITGVSRSLTHELIRHRHLSPSQLSQRFVDESECAFVVPPAIRIRPGAAIDPGRYREDQFASHGDFMAFGDWLDACRDAGRAYEGLVESIDATDLGLAAGTARRKAVREAARSVLPNCAATQIAITLNARAARNLIEQRGSLHADAEFRRLATALAVLFKSEAPNLFADCSVEVADDGREYVTVAHHKV